MSTTPKRRWFRWFQVSIREAALLLLAVSLALGWYLDHRRWDPVRESIRRLTAAKGPAAKHVPFGMAVNADGVEFLLTAELLPTSRP